MKKCIFMALLICLAGGTAWALPVSQTPIDPIAVSANTGEKPQSKVWQHAGDWWSVLADGGGTWLRKLVGTEWTGALELSSATNTKADCKVVGDVVHILLFTGSSSQLVSLQYNSGTGFYEAWSSRPTPSSVTLDSAVEIATIDIDSNGRMWLASDGSTTIEVRYSDSPYSSWSGPITLATGISTDDISVVTALPNGTVGVLWSNQSTKRFGFKTHVDGADPNTWSTDEVPASQSANDGVGGGMADDHLNVAVASDGTLYAAIKTSYDTSGYPLIGLLVRRPAGTWDDLYEVSQTGTRGIVLLNEATNTVSVVYTDGGIVLKESPTSSISFGSAVTLMTGSLNDATSTKQNISDEVVILASTSSSASGVLCTYDTSEPSCLAGWWPMEEGGGTTIVDASGSGNNGTAFGAPVWNAGVIGTALDLNGTTDYALVADAPSLDITDEITLAAWVKPEKVGTQYLVKKAIQSGTDGYELSLSSSGLAFGRLNQTTNGNAYRVDASTPYPTDGNTWMHLAMTYDGAMVRFYVNGVKEDSVAASIGIATNSLNLGIGAQSDGASRFQGAMDDVHVYCRALGPSEIQELLTPPNRPPIALCQNVTVLLDSVVCSADVDPSQVSNGSFDPDGDPITLALDPPGPYSSGVTLVDLIVSDGSLTATCEATITIDCTPPDTECVAGWWAMEEGIGSVVVDSSSYGNNGTLYGSPAWVSGVHGLSLDLNGTTDYALVPDAASLDITDEITLAAWVKPEKVGTQYLVKKAVISVTDGYELSLSAAGTAFGRLNQVTNANTYRVDATTAYPTDGNTWMHLAMTYDGAMIRLYVDGVKEDSVTASISIATNDLSLGIGSQSNGTTVFQGAMDEARVYCRALGPNEIQALAQPPANDPPVAVCQNVVVPSGHTCPVAVDASEVDNGSYDPDGDPITLALDPPGPYPNGVTIVDLIVSDGSLADTCAATITVDCVEPPECIAGEWSMDEGSGTVLVDVSGTGNDGTIYGAPAWITGVTGLALDLNGTSDHARVPDDPTLDITDEITLAAWIRPEKVGTQYLIKKANIDVTDGYELSLSTSGLAFVRFNQFTSANGYRIDTTTPYPTDGSTWMHLAATYDGSTIRLYVNGTQESSASVAITIAANDLDLAIGSQSDGTRLFQGAMDDARVYCRALSPTEIKALASCAVVPTRIDFGTVTSGDWRDETFNVINLGSEILSGDISESCDQFSIVSGSGPYSIAPGESLTVTVRFSPTVSGEDTCVVDTGSDLCDDVTLSGVGDTTMEVSVVPDYALTNCATLVGYTFHIEAGLNEVRGYNMTLLIDTTVVTIADPTAGGDFIEGTFLSSVGGTFFGVNDDGGGVYTVSCAILGGDTGATGSGGLFTVNLTPVAQGTSSIAITTLQVRDPDNVPLTAISSDGDVQVDCTVPLMQAIVEVQNECYNTAPTFSVFTFRDDLGLDRAEYQIDTGGWNTIFTGLAFPDTVWTDPGWELPGFAGLSEGSHTVYFRVKDDAGNWNGEGTPQPNLYSWAFIKDTVAPGAPTDFLALPGHNRVHLTWTNPTGDESFEGVEIRRVAWEDYPQYGTPGPGEPSYPANQTEGTMVTQTGLEAYDDDPVTPRDIYYYAAFSYDCAGNYSAAAPTSRDRATSYWLGDVDPALTGDGGVAIGDLAIFSMAFGQIQGGGGWNAEADFGPTDDYSGYGIPLPDDVIDFEDLMILALNYGNVSPAGTSGLPIAAAAPVELHTLVSFRLEVVSRDGTTVTYAVQLDNEAEVLKGFALGLDYGIGNELVEILPARGLTGKASEHFFGTVQREMGKVEICVAALGVQKALDYTGEIARVVVRETKDVLKLEGAVLRDTQNRGDRVEISDTGGGETPFIPTVSALEQNYPNPFNPVTTITYDVSAAGHVTVAIYDVSGRLVRRLVDTHREAGCYTVTWDGRDGGGNTVRTGVYFYRMTAPGYRSPARKMLLLK